MSEKSLDGATGTGDGDYVGFVVPSEKTTFQIVTTGTITTLTVNVKATIAGSGEVEEILSTDHDVVADGGIFFINDAPIRGALITIKSIAGGGSVDGYILPRER